ncbi:MAG: glycosyl hydrolase family 28-related protein [Anaerolineae bacterium]|nr:glycosyl hydrolase family 28-related protein [Anaerolineae bacterium]
MENYDIRDYGAVGDGKTLDTAAIQAAIDACAVAGGGYVQVPNGTYVTGTVRLRNGVTLVLSVNATLLGSTDIADYAPGVSGDDFRFRHCLIYARDVQHVGIEGKGTVDGRGAAFPCVSRQDSIPAFRGEERRQQ